jgi:hypothetical protein
LVANDVSSSAVTLSRTKAVVPFHCNILLQFAETRATALQFRFVKEVLQTVVDIIFYTLSAMMRVYQSCSTAGSHLYIRGLIMIPCSIFLAQTER